MSGRDGARLAIFDVDHTITRHSTGRRLIQCGRRHGLFTAGALLSLPYHYLRYRAGVINLEKAAAALLHLEGRSRDELEALALQCYRARIQGDILRPAVRLLEEHRRAGDVIVLATSSLGLIVRPLADELAVDHLIATEIEYDGRLATGRLASPPCLGPRKLELARELSAELGTSLDHAAFYSDSHLDLPLMEAVGRPVAVNPDRRLRRIAGERGWQVVRIG